MFKQKVAPRKVAYKDFAGVRFYEGGQVLAKPGHFACLLGDVGEGNTYSMSPQMVETLVKMPKVEQDIPNQIEIGGNILWLESTDRINPPYVNTFCKKVPPQYQYNPDVQDRTLDFCVQFFEIVDDLGENLQHRAVLNVREVADEMGGALLTSYLTPIAVLDSTDNEVFLHQMMDLWNINLGTPREVKLDNLKRIAKERAAIRKRILEQLERQAIRVNRSVEREIKKGAEASVPMALVAEEVAKMQKDATQFTRPGKIDFAQSKMEMTRNVIAKNDLMDNPEMAGVVAKIDKYQDKAMHVVERSMRTSPQHETVPQEMGVGLRFGMSKSEIEQFKSQRMERRQARQKQTELIKQRLPQSVRNAMKGVKFDFDKVLGKLKKGKNSGVGNEVFETKVEKRKRFAKHHREVAARIADDTFELVDDEVVADVDVVTENAPPPDMTEEQVECAKLRLFAEGKLEEHKSGTATIDMTSLAAKNQSLVDVALKMQQEALVMQRKAMQAVKTVAVDGKVTPASPGQSGQGQQK